MISSQHGVSRSNRGTAWVGDVAVVADVASFCVRRGAEITS